MTFAFMAPMWDAIAERGWQQGYGHVSGMYPGPGSEAFEDDFAFLQLPIFPAAASGMPTFVCDAVWHLPKEWFHEFEVRPENYLRLPLDYDTFDAGPALVEKVMLAAMRAMYLATFKAPKPLGLSALRIRNRIFRRMSEHAFRSQKPFPEFDEEDLATIARSLDRKTSKSLAPIYASLRRWKARSGDRYPMFEPPKSAEETRKAVKLPSTAPTPRRKHKGLDTKRMRSSAPSEKAEGRTFKPFPDPFVAAAGEFCVRVLETLAPVFHSAVGEVLKHPERDREAAVDRVIASTRWPLDIEVANRRIFRMVGALCQLALIILLSLLLGCRWSEIGAFPIANPESRGTGENRSHKIAGRDYKGAGTTAGTYRDWPITSEVVEYIERHKAYILATEGEGFRTLWRSHDTIWGGGNPLRAIDKPLKVFAKRWGFEPLLDGSKCHHHRFRKTMARMVVIALYGGPTILRRLFGHETLTVTLSYILADKALLDELWEMAMEEHRMVIQRHVERRHALRGGGAEVFRAGIEALLETINITVPMGRRDQERVTTDDMVDAIMVDRAGLSIKQILPGLVSCLVPTGEAGLCARGDRVANLARCDATCRWHAIDGDFIEQARVNVRNALVHLRGKAQGSASWRFFSGIIVDWARDFPELRLEFAGDPDFDRLVA